MPFSWPGLLGSMLGYMVYPPLDAGPFLAFVSCVFCLPIPLQLASVLRKRLREDAGWSRTVYACSNLALMLLAVLLFLNGRLDDSPSIDASTADFAFAD